jgi:preprotein translocase subunit SecE
MNDIPGRIKKFILDTIAEMRKCTWPNRQELFESTILVVIAVVVLGFFVAGIDEISRFIINFVTTI